MARAEGGINFPNNFEVKKAAPLDARLWCSTLDDMYALEFTHKGMIVAVTDETDVSSNGIYVMQNQIAPDAISQLSDWEMIGGGAGNPIKTVAYEADEDDLVITLEDDTEFTVNIPSGSGPTASGEYDSNLQDSQVMTFDLGGISSGTTVAELDGKTFSELFDTLLFPTAYPTYSNPSASLSNNAGIRKIGESINFELNPGFNLGSINTTWEGSQGTRAGGLTLANISYGGNTFNNLNAADNGSFISDPYLISNYNVAQGSNSFTLDITLSSGIQPKDSKGNDYQTPYGGGSFSKSTSFEGVYPIFKGNSSGNFDEMSLVSMISPGTVILSQDFGDSDVGVRHQVSIPVAMGTPTIQEYDYSKVGVWISSEWDSGVTETRNGVEYKLFTKAGLSSGGDSEGQPKYKLVF